jgi:hypothetical protein
MERQAILVSGLAPLPRFERLTEDREVANVLERPRQTQQEANDQAHNTKYDSACGMLSDSIHGNREAEHMCTHDEDQD